jgi:hypothetical protein
MREGFRPARIRRRFGDRHFQSPIPPLRIKFLQESASVVKWLCWASHCVERRSDINPSDFNEVSLKTLQSHPHRECDSLQNDIKVIRFLRRGEFCDASDTVIRGASMERGFSESLVVPTLEPSTFDRRFEENTYRQNAERVSSPVALVTRMFEGKALIPAIRSRSPRTLTSESTQSTERRLRTFAQWTRNTHASN